MKRLALAAVLLVALCAAVAFAQQATSPFEPKVKTAEAEPPMLYVQVKFYSTLNGNTDAEALAAWNSFVAEVNKLRPCTGTWEPRKPYPDKSIDPGRDCQGSLNQPRLTSAQIATLSVEIGKLLDSPCFRSPQFSMKLSRTAIAIKPPVDPKARPIPRSEWDKYNQ